MTDEACTMCGGSGVIKTEDGGAFCPVCSASRAAVRRSEEFETHKEFRAEALRKMRAASETFYRLAVQTQVHAFIEFTGLMNEYITLCEGAEAAGIDWLMANTHTNTPLPIKEHHVGYLAEKLDCIYGPSLEATGLREFFARAFVHMHQPAGESS